jgi:probable addiction module antidote protein
MPKRTKNYEIGLHERLQDPAYAMEYLQAALEDDEEGSDAVFLLALRDVARANRMTYVAEATGLNRESLYKMLSRSGNPGINSLKAVLNAVGLRLSVEVAERKPAPQQIASWSVARSLPARTLVPGELLSGLPATAPPHHEAGLECLANPPPGLWREQTSGSGPCT